MAFTVRDVRDLTQVLTLHPEWRAEVRRLVLTDELLALPDIVRELAEAQARTEARLEQLAEAQARTEARLEQLAEAQARTEARLEQLTARVDALAEAQARTEARLEQLAADVRSLTQEVRRLTHWQRGEAGRREGERYELRIVTSAPALFNGGAGGAPGQSLVQQHLTQKLKPLLASRLLADEENPFLADLIWWKEEQYLVVEASLQVNGTDVARAARRAETLRQANVQAMGLVVGQEWTGEEIRRRAESSGVQWKVGDDFSEGWLEFRRLAA
jgi:seryl-tRNA synthetase